MDDIQGYELDIKTATIVTKGQGLCTLAIESLEQDDEVGWEIKVYIYAVDVRFIHTNMDSWYCNLKYYLQNGFSPNHLDAKRRSVKVKLS